VGRIICANGSTIMAIAQGAEKMRSYTFSAILSDEMGFQDKAEEAYTAALPTIEGFFKALCFDAIRSAE
jgi:phage FluMu gp28-like protein